MSGDKVTDNKLSKIKSTMHSIGDGAEHQKTTELSTEEKFKQEILKFSSDKVKDLKMYEVPESLYMMLKKHPQRSKRQTSVSAYILTCAMKHMRENGYDEEFDLLGL